jgi:phosphoglycolate phosphatase-like HAD superfamily hydrolase
MQAARAANMVALGASFGYIGAHDEVHDWPVTAWIDEPLELLAWVGLRRAALLRAPHAGA